ncbi:3-oxoacyl-ACP synthase III family protein [Streptomyces sp. DG2A-72]|uniref:3-oxoacyl-ACP synthase III family protein n=1 Tax=Streptomyces sp. DG2A-72 TaxID=3051386 RepID=UPI00265B7986|nr:3-oxoacyl-ACP synthase III family protein [Streptomyces sp. DG2A-72]MDO0931747.1 3-oxoacyl-ACP synthase III family protein [Streptomyces sp. DG2A-72]
MTVPAPPAVPTVHVAAAGSALPGAPVDNASLAASLGVNEEWIDHFIGTRTRHFARDLSTGEVRWSLADLCAEATSQAIECSGTDPADIEFIVLGTATPDHLMPATVNEIADRLGLDQIPTYQLQSGCAGAVQALALAHTFISSGTHRTGLAIGGDVCTKHLDLRRDLASAAPGDLVNCVLFGDGAGAAVIGADAGERPVALRRTLNRCTGLGRSPGQIIDWFGLADRHDQRQVLTEDYKAIEGSVPAMAVEILWELLDDLGWSAEDLDFLLPPQLSGRMTRLITEQLGLPAAREISCVADTGNNGNALPFLQLQQLMKEIAGGQKALAVAVESSKWIKAGFALEGL